MSIAMQDVLAKQFSAEVKHKFQEKGVLRDTVRIRNIKGAKSVQFNLMGRGVAAERGAIQTPIPLMNVSHAPVVATVKDFTASELTDVFLSNQVNFDERAELVDTIANALGRRLDQVIIDALVAANLSKTVAKDISGSEDNLTIAAIRAAAEQLDNDGVPDGDRTLVISPSGLHYLLKDNQASSADFNSVRALVRGDLNTFYGFNIKKIGSREEGGLPLATNDRTNFAYHREAIGLALNMDVSVRIDFDEQYGAHRVTGYLSAGAAVVDALGAVKITTSEA